MYENKMAPKMISNFLKPNGVYMMIAGRLD